MKANIMLSAEIFSTCDLNKNICNGSKVEIEKLNKENEKLLKMIELNENMTSTNKSNKVFEKERVVIEPLDDSKRSDSGIISDLIKNFKKSSGDLSDDGENSIYESSTLNLDYKSLIAAMSSVNIENSNSKTTGQEEVNDVRKKGTEEFVLCEKVIRNNGITNKTTDNVKSQAQIGNITDIQYKSSKLDNKKSSVIDSGSGKFSIVIIDKSKKSTKHDKPSKNTLSQSEFVKNNFMENDKRLDKNNGNTEGKSKKSFKSYSDYGKHNADKHHDTFSAKLVDERQKKYANKTHDMSATLEQLSHKISDINISGKEREHSKTHRRHKHSGDEKYSSTEGESKVDKDKGKSKEARKHCKSGELIDKKEKNDKSKNKEKVIFLERGPVRCKTNDIRNNMPPYERQQIHRNSLSGGKVLMAVSPFDYEKPLIPKTVNSSTTDNLDLRFMVQPKSKEKIRKDSKKDVPHELAAIVDQLRRESARFSSAKYGDKEDSDLWNDTKGSPEDFCNWEEDLNMIMEILEGDNRLKSKRVNLQSCHVPVIDTNILKTNSENCIEKISDRDVGLQSLYHLGSSALNSDQNEGLYGNDTCRKDDMYSFYCTGDVSSNTSVSSPETENIMYPNKNFGSQSVPLTIQLSSPVSSEYDSRKHTPDSGVSHGSSSSVSLSPFSYQTNGNSPMHGFRSPSLDRSDNCGSENHLYEYSYKPYSVSRESYSSTSPLQSPKLLFQEDDLEFVNDALGSYISAAQSDLNSTTNNSVFKENSISQDTSLTKDFISSNPQNPHSNINCGAQLVFNNPQSSLIQNVLGNGSDSQTNELCAVLGLSESYKSLNASQKYKESVNFSLPEAVINNDIVKDSHRNLGLQTDRTFKLIKRKLVPIASKESFPCCVSYKKSAKDILEEMFDRLDDNLKKMICFQVHGIDDYKLMDLFDGQLSSWNESVGSQLPRLPFLYATCERLLMSTTTITKFFEVYMNGHTVLDRAVLTCSQTPLVARYLAECSMRALPRLSISKDISIDKSDLNGSGVLHRCALMGTTCAVSLAGLLSLNSQEQVFNVNRLNADGYSPLHIACSRHSTNVTGGQCCCLLTVHVILVHGQADPNIKDGKSGNTALHTAVDSGPCAPGLVTLLLQHGAKPLIRNYSGATPLDHARTASRSANRPQFPKQVMDILKKYK